MIAGLTARQLNEWMVYDSIEPFGEYRAELRHGQAMAMMANLNRDSDKRPEPFTARDFMNFLDPVGESPEREYTDEELDAYAAQIFGV